MNKPFIIAIGGPSGSGKSTLALTLREMLPLNATIIGIDCYFRDLSHLCAAERDIQNFDIPSAIDQDLLRNHVGMLIGGQSIGMPIYDFATHTRKQHVHMIEPQPVIIVEGIFALAYPDVLPIYDLKVYMHTNLNLCLDRRIERDVAERARTQQSVVRQYNDTVRPMAERYVLPTRQNADIVVSGEADVNTAAAEVIQTFGQKYTLMIL